MPRARHEVTTVRFAIDPVLERAVLARSPFRFGSIGCGAAAVDGTAADSGDRSAGRSKGLRHLAPALGLVLLLAVARAIAIPSVFTYQGSLIQAGQPASGVYDFQFALQDQAGTALGSLSFDNVAVAGGAFAVELDFGAAAFNGDERFLAISVREGASTAAYVALTPRTRITPAPYAQESIIANFAEGVASNTVAGPQLIDGSIAAADIDANQVQRRVSSTCATGSSIRGIGSDGTVVCETDDGGSSGGTVTSVVAGSGLSGGTITASGTLSVDTAAIQARVTGECPTGQYMRQIQQTGLVACESVTTAAGTVRTVSTGAGLTGGPITSSGTVSIANGGVTAAMIAAGAVGASQVNAAEVQLRLQGACAPIDFIAAVGSDGVVSCMTLPIESHRTLESLNDVGSHASLALRSDGRPIIAHVDRTNSDLRLMDCSGTGCTAGTARVLDTFADAQQTATAIRPDGRPLIAYSASGLMVYDCSDSACASGVERVLDGGPGDGLGLSMALRSDGRALISYISFTTAEARVYDCADANCAAGTVRVIDPNLTVSLDEGQRTAIAVGASGTAWVAYQDATPDDVRLVRCTASDCSTFAAPRTVDSSNVVGAWLSMDTSTSGVPYLAYLDSTLGVVKLAICASATSCATSTIRELNPFGNGSSTAIALRSTGEPLIAIQQSDDADLSLIRCDDSSCSTSSEEEIADGEAASPKGLNAALALRPDDRPVVVHRAEPAGDLLFVICAEPTCSD
jgi:hypothetical protein